MRKFLMIMIMISLCLGLTGLVNANDTNDRMLVRVNWSEQAELQQLIDWDIEFAARGAIRPGVYVEVIVTDDELNKIEAAGYKYTILHQSLRDIQIDSEYMDYQEVMDDIQLYEFMYPDLVKVYDIGDSWAKVYADGDPDYISHDIWAVKISDNVEEEEDETCILFCGLHHAREPISVNMVIEILHELTDNYESDEEIQRYVDNLEIWLVPLLNPDGHHLVITDWDVWWRKNVRDNNNNGNIDDYDGVDPNRNYSYKWELGETDPRDDTYHGPEPFSEPENQAIRDLCLEHRPMAALTYHTHGEWVLYPFSYGDAIPPDVEVLRTIAEAMADINGYTPSDDIGYGAAGDMTDWAYTQFGTMAYTIEMATQFIPPGYQIQGIIDLNLPINTYLMDRALRSKIEVHAFDAETEEPLVARVDVLEIPIQDDFEPRMTDPLFGRHDRALMPGDYTITVNTYGYHEATFEVTIVEDAPTIIDAAMQPFARGDIEGVVYDGADFPNPIVGASVSLIHPVLETETVTTDENGFYQFDLIFEGEYGLEVVYDGYDMREQSITVVGDQVNEFDFTMIPAINFEEDEAGFYTEGRSEWEWGVPEEEGGPAEAHSGSHLWGTDLNDNYDPLSNSYLYTPTYRLSSDPTGMYGIGFFHWYETSEGWDGGNVQITNDDGDTWTIVHPNGGYTDGSVVALGGRPGFTGDSDGWQHVYFDLSSYMDQDVRFRFRFSTTNNAERGWFIDDFAVYGSDIYTGVDPNEFGVNTPAQVHLYQNVPNPFNPKTTIFYTLPTTSDITMSIYDLSGKLIRQWTETAKSAGQYSITWYGDNNMGQEVQSGMYLYRLQTENQTITKRMVLLR